MHNDCISINTPPGPGSEPRGENGRGDGALTSCPSPVAHGTSSVQSRCTTELDADTSSGSCTAAGVSSMITMSTSSDSDAEQLLTSGDGNLHESLSSKSSYSSRRLQKLIRREMLLDRLEILASALLGLLLGKKNADGDHGDGLRLSPAASTAGLTADDAFSRVSLEGRRRG
jgi:hypothetical protein